MTRTADTVADAIAHPEREQPYAELGLKPNEYADIREILGRRPTSGELAMYSVMWSEHCSYKSSKVHLKQFGDKKPETDTLLVGIGENAGVVDIGQGWAVTFKVESHNHPSYVEPYQGAATGIGGIVRDIISMGARPIAVMDPLRFGAADHPDTHRVLPGVVAGIGGYGNCLGLPNIGGEVVFDDCYQGNPLVNALCVGKLRHEDIHLASARGVGNLVVLYGAKTGGDGIGGASILASETFEDGGPAKRPAVQVGDPFMEKLLIECTLEVLHAGLVEGIQDLGAAGISCATSELASNGEGGMRVDLDKVPLRDHTLTPEEILMSESQERMAAVVTPGNLEAFLAICAKWDVDCAVIGEVTDTGRLVIEWHGEVIVDVPPRTVAHDGPVYERPYARPSWQDALQAADPVVAAAAGVRRRGARHRAAPGRLAQPREQDLGHRPVRPLRARQHRARAARGRGSHPRRRGERPRRRALDRLQRPVRQARPVRRRQARAGRGLPQRRRHRRRAARRHQLPELRLARGPRRHVAVRPGRHRSRGRLPRARHPGHRRQRQLLQPDRRRRDPPDPGRRRARRDRGRLGRARRWPSARPATPSSCSARRATSSPGRSGRTWSTATSAVCRRWSTSPPSARWARCSSRPRPRGSRPRRTTSRTPASCRCWSRWRCAAGSVPRCPCPRVSTRSCCCSRSRPHERSSPSLRATSRRSVPSPPRTACR